MMGEGPLRYGLRTSAHYAVVIAIALVCAIPLLWTLSVALGTQGNVFAFPASLVDRKSVV